LLHCFIKQAVQFHLKVLARQACGIEIMVKRFPLPEGINSEFASEMQRRPIFRDAELWTRGAAV
jgi:hypothetical protein